jgi:hypothetical protein
MVRHLTLFAISGRRGSTSGEVRGTMPLVSMTVRFDRASYDYIRDEARDAGVSVAQFVREAALIRAALRGIGREAEGPPVDFKRVADEVERRAKVR